MTTKPLDAGDKFIRLSNPVEQHYATFVYGNSLKCNSVVEFDSSRGQHVVICGAGPTLAETAAEWCPQADQVWGCNSALTWLINHGHKATHGFCIDQTPQMLDEWRSVPDVEYILASTVHPHLTELLIDNGRSIRFFHNYVGINERPVEWEGKRMEFEDWMYALLFPPTMRAGSGLNAVTRAIDVACFCGFNKITVLGADCALRVTKPAPEGMVVGTPAHREWLEKHVIMHADGGNAIASGATPMTIEGEFDGRLWTSKPDMMISAVFLVKMKRHLGDRLNLVGDTLPNALADKDDAFLARLPTLIGKDGKPIMFG